MLYKNNKNHFKQARAASNAQALLKNLVEQKKRENAPQNNSKNQAKFGKHYFSYDCLDKPNNRRGQSFI